MSFVGTLVPLFWSSGIVLCSKSPPRLRASPSECDAFLGFTSGVTHVDILAVGMVPTYFFKHHLSFDDYEKGHAENEI